MKVLPELTLCSLSLLFLSGCASTDLKIVPENEDHHKVSHNQSYVSNDTGETIPVHTLLGDYIRFNSVDKLTEIADFVVVGKPQANIEDSVFVSVSEENSRTRQPQNQIESIVVGDDLGSIVDAYTITPFRVQRYLKGQLKTKEIKIIQSVAYIQEEGKSPYLWINKGFSPLERKSRYILFLKEVDTATYPNLSDVYSIVSVNQGKFNLDQTDSGELQVEGKDQQYRNLKDKVRERFGQDFLSTPD